MPSSVKRSMRMSGQSVIVAMRATTGRLSFSTTGRARSDFSVNFASCMPTSLEAEKRSVQRICRKRLQVKWLSASWRMKYRACRMRRPPVLKSRCWRLVRDQFWMATGRTSRQEIAEVVGDHPEEQPHLIGPEPVTREAGARGGGVAPPYSLLRPPAFGVGEGDRSGRAPRGGGEDHPGEQVNHGDVPLCCYAPA